MDSALSIAVREVEELFDNIRDYRIVPEKHSPGEIRQHLEQQYDFKDAVPLDKLVIDMSTILKKWGLLSVHPAYFGYFNPSVKKSAMIGDLLAAAYNPNLAVWSHGTAAHEIEKHLLRHFADAIGYDPDTSFGNFTSGGAEANLTAVLAALSKKYPEYGNSGIASIDERPVVYVSHEAHDSFSKIVHMTGLGRNVLRKIKTTENLKLDLSDLARQVSEDRANGFTPILAAATAGTTAAGIIDPLKEMAEFCMEHNIWLHVDGAWGGAAVMSERGRKELAGIENADSVACDAHKWLSASMGAGMFFCRESAPVHDAFRVSTAYMPGSTEGVEEPYITTVQWSRRFIGLKVFMVFAELGRSGVAALVDDMIDTGIKLKNMLAESGWRIVNDTPFPVICFTHELIENGEISIDDILERIYRRGKTWISKVTLDNGRITALRACITSWRTEQRDLDTLIKELDDIIRT